MRSIRKMILGFQIFCDRHFYMNILYIVHEDNGCGVFCMTYQSCRACNVTIMQQNLQGHHCAVFYNALLFPGTRSKIKLYIYKSKYFI